MPREARTGTPSARLAAWPTEHLRPRYLRGLLRTTETLGLPSPGERDCTS